MVGFGVAGFVLVVLASGYGCGPAELACEPSGTYASGVRAHGSQLCEAP